MTKAVVAAVLLATATVASGSDIRSFNLSQTDGSASLVHETVVKAPSSAVWAMVSTLDGWKSWSVPYAWQSNDGQEIWETSFSEANKQGSPNNVKHQIIARIPGKMFVFKTIQAPKGFPGAAALANVTWIIELVPVSKSETLVRISGVGFSRSADGQAALAFFEGGNQQAFQNLQRRTQFGPLKWSGDSPARRR